MRLKQGGVTLKVSMLSLQFHQTKKSLWQREEYCRSDATAVFSSDEDKSEYDLGYY